MPRLFAVAAFLLAAAWATAGPPSEADIRQWVRDLDHPRYRVRDAASRALLNAGALAVNSLVIPAGSENAEVADRAIKILGELAESPDTATETAARDALRKLAGSPKQVSATAQAILNRKRHGYVSRLEALGAKVSFDGEGVDHVDLDAVKQMREAMALLKEFPEVTSLSASTKAFDNEAAKMLTALPNVRDLNLFQSAIGDEALKTIGTLRHLRRIPMGQTLVTDAGLKHITNLTDLEYVGLRGDDITDAGLKTLRPLKNLTGLNLGSTKVSDAGVAELMAFPNLQHLYLDHTATTDACLPTLTALTDLEMVTLIKTGVSLEGRAKLKVALPRLRIADENRDDAP